MTFDANMYGCTFTIIDVLSLPLFIFFFLDILDFLDYIQQVLFMGFLH